MVDKRGGRSISIDIRHSTRRWNDYSEKLKSITSIRVVNMFQSEEVLVTLNNIVQISRTKLITHKYQELLLVGNLRKLFWPNKNKMLVVVG